MLFISNCGNINGPDITLENNPDYLQIALDKGYHVVVDTWVVPTNEEKKLRIASGALEPQYDLTLEFLQNDNVIARAKSLTTLQILLDNNVHCVLDSTSPQLTSRNLLWNYAGHREIIKSTIINMPELLVTQYNTIISLPQSGICSNYIGDIKNIADELQTPDVDVVDNNLDNVTDDPNIIVLS